jgi:hypothetical protein
MSKKNELIPVRLSHLLGDCSVGAIVRGPNYLMTVKDIREWTDKNGTLAGEPIRYVDGVRSALGIVQELREPPVAKELDTGWVEGICVPAQRFPSWMRCPFCNLLHYQPWKGQPAGEQPRCQGGDPKKCPKKPILEQAPWVLIHAEGHMADVPWHFLAHRELKPTQNQCRSDWNEPYLYLTDQGASSRQLRCVRCNAKTIFDHGLRVRYGKAHQQPWIWDEAETVEDWAAVLEINDARVHAPQTCSALVIPPESRVCKGSVVDRLYASSQKLKQIEQARTPLARKGALSLIADDLRCSFQQIEEALLEIGKGYPLYEQNITQGILLESEYQALLDEMPDVKDDEDFVPRHHTRAWKALTGTLPNGTNLGKIIKAVSHLIAVNRLKEIMVLRGFKRLGQENPLVPPDIVGKSDWLPALELYGEGVFFSLDETPLKRWEALPVLQERAENIQKRYARFQQPRESPSAETIVTPRFLLLHTLAHLLIRQLETQAGYPAASLKERIYCTAGTLPMSGILIYVAVHDVVGSLGGLAELATPKRFLPLLSSVFDHAERCSLDPVCSEHGGQGPSLLNRAACHACALIPEPSCTYGNVLLDRAFIKGDFATDIPAFLNCLG